MSEYRLVVTRIDPNPAYNAEEAERRRLQGWQLYDQPATFEIKALDVLLTPAEYATVKRAVLQVTAPDPNSFYPPAGAGHADV